MVKRVHILTTWCVNFAVNDDRSKRGAYALDSYLSAKHDGLLTATLEPGTYKKTFSLVIVDGFAVEISEDQVPCDGRSV